MPLIHLPVTVSMVDPHLQIDVIAVVDNLDNVNISNVISALARLMGSFR